MLHLTVGTTTLFLERATLVGLLHGEQRDGSLHHLLKRLVGETSHLRGQCGNRRLQRNNGVLEFDNLVLIG